MKSSATVVLYVGRDCTFSQIALARVREAVRLFGELQLMVKDQSKARADGVRVPVTPTLVLPDLPPYRNSQCRALTAGLCQSARE